MTVPGRALIGAYHAEGWAGLVLCRRPGEGLAFRFGLARRRRPVDGSPAGRRADGWSRADGGEMYWLVRDVGPHAPDGSYARLTFDPGLPLGRDEETPLPLRRGGSEGLTLEWGRVNDGAVVGRLTASFQGAVELRPHVPWDWPGRWRRREGILVGRSGESAAVLRWRFPEAPTGDGSPLRFPVADGSVLRFAAAVAGDPGGPFRSTSRLLQGGWIDRRLERARHRQEDRRVRLTGPHGGAAAAVTRCIRWMVLLQPESGRRYVPAGRRWIFPRPGAAGAIGSDGGAGAGPEVSPAGSGPEAEPPRDHWTIFGWDSFFNALEAGLEDPALARETLEAGLATQYPNGNVPNWRGRFGGTPDRSHPPLASYAALKLHARREGQSLLEAVFPALERWSAWWRADRRGRPRRDGNEDGLFEWGSDLDRVHPSPPPWERGASHLQKAAWESGQDDLPNWEEATWSSAAETMELSPVDLNSYLALDLECLSRIAAILGEDGKARAYRERRRRLGDRMNERLWDEDRGAYLDRRWDGTRSPRIAASNFLPLLAGIPGRERARRMVERLTDPGQFWGRWIMPSVARPDPAYPEQQYWRGAVWPPMNYLVCQGLRRYGFYREAGTLARRSAELFLRGWRAHGVCRENYDSRTGKGGGRRHQSWGALLPLLAVEEYADVTPWEGIRAGSLAPEKAGTLLRLPVLGRRLTVSQGPDGLSVAADGEERLTADGPAVLRRLELGPDSVAAEVHAAGPVSLRAHLSGDRFRLTVDGEAMVLSEPRFALPKGHHGVRISRAGR